MEQTRLLAMYSILPHHDAKKYGKLKPTDILQFDWDEKKVHVIEKDLQQQNDEAKQLWGKVGPMKTN
jgi:hypothetical protein